MPSVRMLSMDGDRVLVWEKGQDKAMVDFIQKKMDQGYVFFIVTADKKQEVWTALSSAEAAKSSRRVTMVDPDAEEEVRSGRARVVNGESGEVSTTRRAHSAKDAAENDSVAFKQAKGG